MRGGDEATVIGPSISTLGGYVNFTGRLGLKGPPGSVQVIEFEPELIVPVAVPAVGISVTLASCAPGQYEASQICFNCLPGKYTSVSNEKVCHDCPPGTYSDQQQSSSCNGCGYPTFSISKGSLACQTCPTRQYGYLCFLVCQRGITRS